MSDRVIRNGVWRQGVEDLEMQFHLISGWLESLRDKCFDPNTDELQPAPSATREDIDRFMQISALHAQILSTYASLTHAELMGPQMEPADRFRR